MGGSRLRILALLAAAGACGSAGQPSTGGTGGSGGSGVTEETGTVGGAAGQARPDAQAAGGSGGSGGGTAIADAATTTPDAATALPDAGATADAAVLGAFPLEAVKAMKGELWAKANAHIEGPSYRDGEVYFAADGAGWGFMRVDRERKLYRYHPKLSPVGTYLLADGSMLVCDHNYVLVQVFADGKVAQLASDFQGQAIEYCNDVTVDGAGNIYVSGRHTSTIYRITPGGEVAKVATGLNLPNGVEVNPPGTHLYFVNGGNVARIELQAGGGFGKPEMVLSAGQPDGLAFDAWGNLWMADWGGKKLTVMGPDHKVLASIPSGGGPINLAFGDESVWVLNDFKGVYRFGPVTGLRGFLHPGAAKYQVKKMLDLAPANEPVP